jgi:hypothetical protein
MSGEYRGLSINPLTCLDERNFSVYSASLSAATPSDCVQVAQYRGSVSLLIRSFGLMVTPKEAAHAG